MYIRPAIRDDIAEITKLYNVHILHNIAAPETEEVTKEVMESRFAKVRAATLPYHVACEHAIQHPRTVKGLPSRFADITLPDKVIGFAFVTPYGTEAHSIYESTVKLEFWTDRTYALKGVGKCLFDKLLAAIDSGYTERADVEFQGAPTFANTDYKANVKNLSVSVPYEAEKPSKFWLGPWLERSHGPDFVRSGSFERIGEKSGKSLSVAVYHRTTKAAWGGVMGNKVDSAAVGQW